MLHIDEEVGFFNFQVHFLEEGHIHQFAKSQEEKEDPMSQSDSSSLLAEAQAVSRIVTVQLERVSCLVVR